MANSKRVYQTKAKGGKIYIGGVSVKKPDAEKTSLPRRGAGKVNLKLPDFS